jgi:hypothetical protein
MIPIDMERTVSHDRQEETPEAKARWFQSLPLAERMELLCAFTNLVLENNPRLLQEDDPRPLLGRVQVLSLPAD